MGGKSVALTSETFFQPKGTKRSWTHEGSVDGRRGISDYSFRVIRQLTLQSCSNGHIGTMSPLTKLLHLLLGGIKTRSGRASHPSSMMLLEDSTGLDLLPIADL